MSNNKFPWNCGECPMLKTYDMSIDDLTHICLWSKKQIDDCDRYRSAECPLEKHDSELLDKVIQKQRTIIDDDGVMYKVVFLKDIEDMKAGIGE